jgi:hypothetical protein
VHSQPQAVEGVFNSEGELHLLDASTNFVYSTVRDEYGDLVPVGVYNREQKEIEFREVPESGADRSTEQPTVRCFLLALCTS